VILTLQRAAVAAPATLAALIWAQSLPFPHPPAAQKTALTHAPAPSLWRAPHASRHAYARGALAADAPRDPSRACRAPASLATPAPGTFGRVLECWDRRRKEYVAVKIVRNVDKYRHAAMIEVWTCGWPRLHAARASPCPRAALPGPQPAGGRGALRQMRRPAGGRLRWELGQ
jgi:hypothetical protein